MHTKGPVLSKTRPHLTAQSIQQCQSTLAQTISSLLAAENLVRLETAIKSTYINQIACGKNHVLLLTSSGFVYSLGSNEFG